ncbi:hypothetical protein GCM10010350_35520 [Streptomyces galilaeus]|nr:hypothetical protein GCM10010350_35520 [Streptomyces galilaeus]
MQPWFTDAKLGIFVHWGIYAVDGVQESWSFYDDIVPHERYMSQLDRFTGARYDPHAWADLFARAGARYAVLTSRHHDGVALWDTAYGDLNLGRDYLTGYADALRERASRSASTTRTPTGTIPTTPAPASPAARRSWRTTATPSAPPGTRTRTPGSGSWPTATARSASWPPATGRT